MQEGKYRAKLTQYGFLSGQIDPVTTLEKPPQFFASFAFQDEQNANQVKTWFGGFKELQPGKKTSQREITLKTIALLGYTGTQIAALGQGVQSGLLNTEKEYEIDLEYARDQMGNVVTDDKGGPKWNIKWVNDPEKTGFKNHMKPQDCLVKIGGLNLDNEMAQILGGQGGQNNGGGYDLNAGGQPNFNNQMNGGNAANAGQMNNQAPPANMNGQGPGNGQYAQNVSHSNNGPQSFGNNNGGQVNGGQPNFNNNGNNFGNNGAPPF